MLSLNPWYLIDRVQIYLPQPVWMQALGESRNLLRLDSRIAPYEIAVFPLIGRNAELNSLATDVFRRLVVNKRADFDDKGSIGLCPCLSLIPAPHSCAAGRRYRRHDEIGTPFCVTLDKVSLQDQTVTLRCRDSMKQVRLPIEQLTSVTDLNGLFHQLEKQIQSSSSKSVPEPEESSGWGRCNRTVRSSTVNKLNNNALPTEHLCAFVIFQRQIRPGCLACAFLQIAIRIPVLQLAFIEIVLKKWKISESKNLSSDNEKIRHFFTPINISFRLALSLSSGLHFQQFKRNKTRGNVYPLSEIDACITRLRRKFHYNFTSTG